MCIFYRFQTGIIKQVCTIPGNVKKTREQVHYNMSRIRCKDTGIEKRLRAELWSRGLRYVKNPKDVPGKPDIVFKRQKVAVFCDSEFWHGFDWNNRKKDFGTNREFWIEKIERNIRRDEEVNDILRREGWTVIRFWGKEIINNAQGCGEIVEKAMNKTSRFKSIDLFAGIGGIRKGFDLAFRDEISTVFVSEWDEYAQKTYMANYPDTKKIHGDITKIEEKNIPDFDICLAGFPCQAFSIAGSKRGFEDDYMGMSRGTLFFDVARICNHHKPKVIFCENVKGLLMHDKGNTFRIISETLKKIGYNLHEKVLNSRDFGVPQNRERIYIVAFRNDIDSSSFVFPQPTDSGKRIRDIIEKEPVSVKYYLSTTYLEGLRRHRERHESKGHGFGYEIKGDDDVSSAIVCGGMGRERNLIIDKRITDFTPVTNIKGEVNREFIRKMTPREWANLQGFPEDFKLVLSDTHLYKQFGNSVTVPVIEAIAKEIKKVLDGQTDGK